MNKNKLIMKNETEFIFDETLTEGFTVVPNNIFAYEMSDGAIGLYSRILRVKNIAGWKIYQSTLQNKSNGESKIRTAINELIAYGFIEKITLREKGKIAGIKYMVYSSSQKTDEEIKLSLAENNVKKRKNIHVVTREEQRDNKNSNNVESPENTHVQPKREKPVLEKPVRENQVLKKKDLQKRKTLKKKDNTTTKEKENIKNNSSSSDVKLKFTLALKGITKTNIKKLKLNQDQIDLLESYINANDYDNLDKFSYFVAKEIKAGAITKDDLINTQNKKPVITFNKKNEIKNFEETKNKFLEDAANVEKEWLEDFSI